MGSRVTAAYSVISVLAFVVLASWFAYTFFQTRANNYLSAASTFDDLKNSTAITLGSAGRFDAPRFRSFVRSVFLEIPTIDVLTISTEAGGVHFVYARHAGSLVSPRVVDDRWSGSIRYSSLIQSMFSGALPVTVGAGSSPFRVRAVFTILSRRDLYSMARTLLIILLCYVILTGIVILIAPVLGRREGAPAGEGSRHARSRGPGDDEQGESHRGASSTHDSAARPATGGSPGAAGGQPHGQKSSVIVLGSPPEAVRSEESEVRRPEAREAIAPTPSHEAPAAPETGTPTLPSDEPPELESAPAESEGVAVESGAHDTPSGFVDDSLPPGVQLPSLREVATHEYEEQTIAGEISLYEELARSDIGFSPTGGTSTPKPEGGEGEELHAPPTAPAFDVTEVEDHGAPAPAPESTGTDYHSAEDELADIDDFEDLERIDGSSPGEPGDEPPRARVLARETSPVSREPAPAPAPLSPLVSLDEEAETEPAPIILDEEDQTIDVTDGAVDLSVSAPDELPAAEVEELLPVEPEDVLPTVASGEAEEGPAPSAELYDLTEPPEDDLFLDLPLDLTSDLTVRPETTKQDINARDLFNPATGLAWRDHLEQRLSFELDRAASFDQDLALSIVRFREPADDETRVSYAREIRAYFPFHDLCFDYGPDSFAIVLPNVDIDQAIHSMENFNETMNAERPGSPKVLFGLSARNGRLLGGERLLSEAESAAEKASEDRHNSIFALRVDPGKYREFIKSTLK